MAELLELIAESTPFALGFTILCWLIACLTCLIRHHRLPGVGICVSCLYLGFLLAGTLRPAHWHELVDWVHPSTMDITFQLSLGETVSSLHGLFNVALFLPWGVLGLMLGKRLRALFPSLFSCFFTTLFIETYQLFHWRSFDWSDVLANMLGCVSGIILALPVLWLQKRAKHLRSQ